MWATYHVWSPTNHVIILIKYTKNLWGNLDVFERDGSEFQVIFQLSLIAIYFSDNNCSHAWKKNIINSKTLVSPGVRPELLVYSKLVWFAMCLSRTLVTSDASQDEHRSAIKTLRGNKGENDLKLSIREFARGWGKVRIYIVSVDLNKR